MRGALGDHLPVGHEPEVFFGPEGLSQLLEQEDWRRDERDVMAFFAHDLKLSVYKASPAWARAHGQRQLYLWVFERNHAARRFYLRQGWRVAQRRLDPIPGGGRRMVLRLVKRL
jgi:hypothetical protein